MQCTVFPSLIHSWQGQGHFGASHKIDITGPCKLGGVI
jgi:hypothetical protein